jgi:hypothetical protein
MCDMQSQSARATARACAGTTPAEKRPSSTASYMHTNPMSPPPSAVISQPAPRLDLPSHGQHEGLEHGRHRNGRPSAHPRPDQREGLPARPPTITVKHHPRRDNDKAGSVCHDIRLHAVTRYRTRFDPWNGKQLAIWPILPGWEASGGRALTAPRRPWRCRRASRPSGFRAHAPRTPHSAGPPRRPPGRRPGRPRTHARSRSAPAPAGCGPAGDSTSGLMSVDHEAGIPLGPQDNAP